MPMNRLFEIIYLLLEQGSTTATVLAEHFEVSTRTIYRDLDALSGAGIPVYCSKGKGGGIHLLPDFVLNKSLLSEQEQNEILFALQSLHAANGLENAQILSRLQGQFRKENINWVEIDFSYWGSEQAEREKFNTLKNGILEQRLMTFSYFSSNGENRQRKVEPVKLHFKNHDWYLQAYCLHKQAYRTFKINRMSDIQLENNFFCQRSEPLPNLNAQPLPSVRQLTLELWLSPSVAFRVYDEFEQQQVTKNMDGSFLVTVTFPENSWVYGYLLSFGEDVQVLSPCFVQETLKNKAQRILNIYRND